MSGARARCFVSVLKREDVVARLSAAIKPFVESGAWVEGYRQYHHSFRLSAAPGYAFGFGVSRVAYSLETFRAHPEIWDRYESNIVYSPLVREDRRNFGKGAPAAFRRARTAFSSESRV